MQLVKYLKNISFSLDFNIIFCDNNANYYYLE